MVRTNCERWFLHMELLEERVAVHIFYTFAPFRIETFAGPQIENMMMGRDEGYTTDITQLLLIVYKATESDAEQQQHFIAPRVGFTALIPGCGHFEFDISLTKEK